MLGHRSSSSLPHDAGVTPSAVSSQSTGYGGGRSDALFNRAVAAVFPTAAVVAVFAAPDEVELLDKWIDEGWGVGEDAVLEVALALRLRAHAGAR